MLWHKGRKPDSVAVQQQEQAVQGQEVRGFKVDQETTERCLGDAGGSTDREVLNERAKQFHLERSRSLEIRGESETIEGVPGRGSRPASCTTACRSQ